jgi:outer membrane lipoprotein-sorting protein
MKKAWLILTIALLLSAGCAGRDSFTATARIEPGVLLEALEQRRNELSTGITGELDMDFKDPSRHHRGDGYITLTPSGKFRLEVPGAFGSTVLLMVSDGLTTVVYYPSESRAYRTTGPGDQLAPFLPFPMPFDPSSLSGMLTGTVSPDDHEVTAYEAASGERLLVFEDSTVSQYRYLFSGGLVPHISRLWVTLEEGELTVEFSRSDPWLPDRFRYTNGDTRMKGRFQWVRIAENLDGSVFTLDLPGNVTLRELGAAQ